MARRRIGQEDLVARPEPRAASSLSELAALLDWREIDRALAGVSAAARGEPGWPPLALFRGLLLATWHDLSDIKLAEALDDRASAPRPLPDREGVRDVEAVLRPAPDALARPGQGGAAGQARRHGLQPSAHGRSEEHTSELQSRQYLVCRLLLEKKKKRNKDPLKTPLS